MNSPTDPLLDEVLDSELPQHARRGRRDFKPWHKPRKQFVRRHQWLVETEQLCSKLHFRDDRPLKYLSLPGEDLLDVRMIQECCEQQGIGLKYLGLNDDNSSEDRGTWLRLAWNEVNSLQHIHRDSLVIKDRFEQIANRNSQAFQYIEQYGPFDVVNLDLCESISAPLEPNYYSALKSLAAYQIRNRTEPWLLLITSRVRASKVAPNDMEKLIDCLRGNVRRYEDFRKRIAVLVPRTSGLITNAPMDVRNLSQPDFVKLFSAGLGKWLLSLMASSSPQWGVLLKSSYSYRVYGQDPDMVSYAFLLEPFIQGPLDTTGLSKGVIVHDIEFDEGRAAVDLLSKVEGTKDVDSMLEAKPALKKRFEDESAALLASARYEPAEYRRWLKPSADG